MKLNIRGKNLSVTPAIKEYIEKKLNKFFKGYDLLVDYDPNLEEPTYHFKKQ